MSLISDAAEMARSLGNSRFSIGSPCANGHTSDRFSSSGSCCECKRLSWERNRRAKGESPLVINEALAKARNGGKSRFFGDPCIYGHAGERYTHNSACIECARIYSRAYSRSDASIAYRKAYHLENIDKARQDNRNMKAKRKGAEGRHTEKDVANILILQRYRCAECRASIRRRTSRHVDHIIPLKLGGSNWPRNIQMLCVACNLRKSAKHPLDFAREAGRLL